MVQDVSAPRTRPSSQLPKATDDVEGDLDTQGEVPGDLLALRAATLAWRNGTLAKSSAKLPPRKPRFTTWSDSDVADVLTPADAPIDYARDLGFPGEYPFTRGVQPTMYRSRLWTMRQFAGFGTPEQTNARFHYLLKQGQTGLSTAFDFPTLMGYDSDSPRSIRCATWRCSSTASPSPT
jgi:methylmalonyl-CoA mutase N-terminal domain/subunit